MIFCKTPPRYPGETPPDDATSIQHTTWQKKADKFAKYYLTMFRPEPEKFNANQPNNYSYNWNALVQWVQELQTDSSLLSKLRLQAFHTRVHGMRSNHRSKIQAAHYRARARDLWPAGTKKPKQVWGLPHSLRDLSELFDEDEIEFKRRNKCLKSTVTANMELQITDDEKQANSLLSTYQDTLRQPRPKIQEASLLYIEITTTLPFSSCGVFIL